MATMVVGLGVGGRTLTRLSGTPLPALAAASSLPLYVAHPVMTPLSTSCGPTRGMSFTASDTSTTWSPLSTPSLKSSKKHSFMAVPSSFLENFAVHRLDVGPDPIAVAPQRILGKPRLVLGRELVADRALHVVERSLVGVRLADG